MHTKGPWELRENWVYPKGKDDDICHLSQSYLRNHGTRMANGTLIAAAPDLLEALKDLTSLYFSSPGVDMHFIKKARAAIDKAEGRGNS